MEKLTQTSYSLLFPKVGMKENNLDFIRFSLALLVLFCHCFVMYYGTEDTVEPLIIATHKQLSLGSLAVNYFFVISGFLIFQSWDKSHNFIDFLKKRILRIFPGFIVASILCLVLFAPLGTADFYMPWGYWKHCWPTAAVIRRCWGTRWMAIQFTGRGVMPAGRRG